MDEIKQPKVRFEMIMLHNIVHCTMYVQTYEQYFADVFDYF